MLYLRDFKGIERYKNSKYFIFQDAIGNQITNTQITEICPILMWEDQKDGGVIIHLAIYNKMPQGYKFFKDAPKAPYGYKWIYNGKSRTNERSEGLLRIEISKDINYKYLKECFDFKYLKEYLPDKSLSYIEKILEAYKEQKIDLIIPRNEDDTIVWDGDWDITIMDKNYKKIGCETLVLKWYEGFEDASYVIDCFMEDYYNEK